MGVPTTTISHFKIDISVSSKGNHDIPTSKLVAAAVLISTVAFSWASLPSDWGPPPCLVGLWDLCKCLLLPGLLLFIAQQTIAAVLAVYFGAQVGWGWNENRGCLLYFVVRQ